MKQKRFRCDICRIDFHRVFYARHLERKKHLGNMIQNKVNTPKKIQ